MIIKTELISDEDGYKRFNHFEINKGLKDILFDDYYLYNKESLDKKNIIENLYNKNFVNKYDREAQKEIFDLYIDNDEFKKKAQFIYSIIDYDKYAKFALENPELDNANEMTIKYSILDSDGVKVQIYHISIIDISFVF